MITQNTRHLAAQDELVDEVQRRMDQVVEAAVEWHQAGREGVEWFDAAERLSAAINSLLELKSKRDAAATTSPETPETVKFRTTKEAMEWAQRNKIPTVVPVPAAGDDEGEKYRSRAAWLREGLLAARDALVPVQHLAGQLPYQDGYSATMTPAELQLSKIISQIDKLLLKDEELAGLRSGGES